MSVQQQQSFKEADNPFYNNWSYILLLKKTNPVI